MQFLKDHWKWIAGVTVGLLILGFLFFGPKSWWVFAETYWPFGAGVVVFVGIVIVVVRMVRKRKESAPAEEEAIF